MPCGKNAQMDKELLKLHLIKKLQEVDHHCSLTSIFSIIYYLRLGTSTLCLETYVMLIICV